MDALEGFIQLEGIREASVSLEIEEEAPEAAQTVGVVARRDAGPTLRIQQRAEVYRRLKEAHPDWSQAKVAMEAAEEDPECYGLTSDAVRNAYRAMGWKWERADRIR